MRKLILPALFFLAAFASYWIVILRFPAHVMNKVFFALGQTTPVNQLLARGPITPESRHVVLPSPDLLYAACVFDLSDGPIEIHVGASETYFSLSLYDSDTNNFHTVNNLTTDGALSLKLVWPKSEGLADKTAEVAVSPTRKGIAIIRRQSGTAELEAQALKARVSDYCQPISD